MTSLLPSTTFSSPVVGAIGASEAITAPPLQPAAPQPVAAEQPQGAGVQQQLLRRTRTRHDVEQQVTFGGQHRVTQHFGAGRQHLVRRQPASAV